MAPAFDFFDFSATNQMFRLECLISGFQTCVVARRSAALPSLKKMAPPTLHGGRLHG